MTILNLLHNLEISANISGFASIGNNRLFPSILKRCEKTILYGRKKKTLRGQGSFIPHTHLGDTSFPVNGINA